LVDLALAVVHRGDEVHQAIIKVRVDPALKLDATVLLVGLGPFSALPSCHVSLDCRLGDLVWKASVT
jgi:hypothetical protein